MSPFIPTCRFAWLMCGLLAAALSNQFYAAYLPDLDHSAQNQSPSPRMGWPMAFMCALN